MATTTAELEIRTTLKDDASKRVEGMGTSFAKLTSAIGIGTLAANAFQKATTFVTDTIKGSIKAAQDAEVSQVKVNAILKTLKGSFEDHTRTVEAASRAALQLGFDDEDAAESMAKLLQVTGDTNMAQKAMADAMDLARFKGIGLEEATQAINLAMLGNTRVLKQLGIDVPEQASKTEILGLVMQRVGGQAQAFGETSAGASERFKNSLENLQESIGARILPVMNKFFNTLSNFLNSDKLQGWLNEISRLYNEYLAPVIRDYVIPAFQALADAIRPHLPLIGNILKILFGVAGAALIGTLVLLSETLKVSAKIFDVVADAIEGVIEDVKTMIDWLKKAMGPIKDFFGAVGNVKDKVGSGIGGAVNSVKDLFRAEGGPVDAGRGYIVGEKGPEWFVPRTSGTIVPNGAGGGGREVTINFNGITVLNESYLQTIVAEVKKNINRELQLASLGV